MEQHEKEKHNTEGKTRKNKQSLYVGVFPSMALNHDLKGKEIKWLIKMYFGGG